MDTKPDSLSLDNVSTGQPLSAARPRGFTLIEIIVSIVLMAFLGTMLASFMGTSVTRSAEPVILAQHGAYLNGIMENMVSDYKHLMVTSQTPMTDFITRVGSGSRTYYSRDGHPYTVVESKRIRFNTGSPVAEIDDPNGFLLKVTIAYQGLELTTLFSE